MPSLRDSWSKVLGLQVRLTRAQDISFLRGLPAFRRAREVLEVGCGSGEFLLEISKAFPFKQFVGLDVNEELLRSAYARSRGRANLRFEKRDLYRLGPGAGEFDLVIVRLVVQHLEDISEFLRCCADMLPSGGCLLVIEADDQPAKFSPAVPSAGQLFRSIRKGQPHRGPEGALRKLKAHASEQGFRVVQERPHHYLVDVDGKAKKLVVEMLSGLGDLARRALGASTDVRKLRKELGHWKISEASTFQFGFRSVLLEKRGRRRFAQLFAKWFRFVR